jgi:ABC-2 type transport system ATP-binding protein
MKVVEASGLTKSYGGRTALDGLSLSVEEGDVFGFLGPNGAGKTTTIRILAGLLAPTDGKAWVAGVDVSGNPRAVKRAVGVLPESQGYYPWMTGEDYLAYFGRLYGIAGPRPRACSLLETVGLAARGRTTIGGYSRGMRQRLGIARAMVHSPGVLFMDEPSLGLDPRGQREIDDLIRRLNREEGITVFLSSHLLSEIEGLCTRFAIVREGRLVAEGDRAQLERRLGKSRRLKLEVSDAERASDLAGAVGGIGRARREKGAIVVDPETDDAAAALLRILISDGVQVYSMQRLSPSLEEIFFGLTEHVEGVTR